MADGRSTEPGGNPNLISLRVTGFGAYTGSGRRGTPLRLQHIAPRGDGRSLLGFSLRLNLEAGTFPVGQLGPGALSIPQPEPGTATPGLGPGLLPGQGSGRLLQEQRERACSKLLG